MDKPLTTIDDASTMRDRIILEASIMFAHRGYTAVSMRDIAEKVDLKPASLYNHFASKEAMFEAILDNIVNVYRSFYIRLDEKIDQVQSFEEVLDCLFEEVIDVYDIYIYYGFSLVVTEQFRDEKANAVFNNVLSRMGIEYSKAQFNKCIQKGWVKPFDTETLATLFFNHVVMGTLMRTHEDMGHTPAYDPQAMFVHLKKLILTHITLLNQ